jgi:hypothetical protein
VVLLQWIVLFPALSRSLTQGRHVPQHTSDSIQIAGQPSPSSAGSNSSSANPSPASAPRRQVDPRGPRFGAVITTIVLAVILVAGPQSPIAAVLLAVQVVAFGAGAFFGLGAQPYGWVFRTFIRPRLAAPRELEDEAPPRFAQAVGLVFALVAAAGLIFGVEPLFFVAVAAALGAAFLNAAFDFCLGCEMYLLAKRIGVRTDSAPSQ